MEIAQVGTYDIYLYPSAGQTEEARREELYEGFLLRAKNYVDEYLGRDFDQELANLEISAIPYGIEDAALRLASNMVLRMKNAQSNFIATREDGSREFLSSRVFTQDIKDDLNLFLTSPIPRFSRNRNYFELEELEAADGGI